MTQSMQFALDLQLCDVSTFDNFIVGNNQQTLQQLQMGLAENTETCFYLTGPQQSGRSHLLQACCHQFGKHNKPAIYLPLEQHQQWHPSLVEGLEQYQLICLDNIESIAGQLEWEEALFHLYNRAKDNQVMMLCSSTISPHHLSLTLKDLQSRLTWGLTLNLNPLEDTQKAQALQLRAKHRGLTLSDECAKYLLNHTSRNITDLFNTLNLLDQASLEHQRKLTIPFINQIFKLHF